MINTALFGGTFDPIHLGHLAVAKSICEQMPIDEFWFVPSALPPHKNSFMFSYQERFEMIKELISMDSRWFISDLDQQGEKRNYTIHLIERFNKFFPNRKLYFVIGEDIVIQLPSWKNFDSLINTIDFIVINRPVMNPIDHKLLPFFDKLHFVNMEPIDISSTQIRQKIQDKQDLSSLIHQKTINYIQNKLNFNNK